MAKALNTQPSGPVASVGEPCGWADIRKTCGDIEALEQMPSPTWPNRNYVEGVVATLQRKDRWREAAEFTKTHMTPGPTTRLSGHE